MTEAAQLDRPADVAADEGFTARMVCDVLARSADNASAVVRERARHALLDFLGVAISGSRQASAMIAQKVCLAEGGSPVAQIVGTANRATARQAALCTGIASHSQDFDDMGMFMHPSIVVLPAILGIAEEMDASGEHVLTAMMRAYETLRIVTAAVTDDAYARGWHCTGTFGALSSAVGAASLLALDEGQVRRALGIAATQASGIRASFGTMSKHLNSGNASAVGVLSARLAAEGFTGSDSVIEAQSGFVSVMNVTPGAFDPSRPEAFARERQGIEELIFKLHAACGATHSSIEGIRQIRGRRPFTIDEIDEVELVVGALTPQVCGIPEPKTGLEGMFSIRFAAALALTGSSTGTDSFTDETVRDPQLIAARDLVKVNPVERLYHLSLPSEVIIRFKSGEIEEASVGIFDPRPDAELPDQWNDLVAKFHALVTPILGEARSRQIVDRVARFDSLGSIRELTALTASS